LVITPITDFSLKALQAKKTGERRSLGLHLTSVIQSILQDLDPAKYGKPGERQIIDAITLARFESGFTFEELMEEAFAARLSTVTRIGEVVLDGIVGSPDGVCLDDDEPYVVETKFTWKSTRGTPWPCEDHRVPTKLCASCGPQEWDSKHLAWELQIAAYTHMLGLTRARIIALFVNGDYKPAGSPALRVWDFRYTPEELAEKWGYLVAHARAKGMLPKAA
jgi:hypothetical protein